MKIWRAAALLACAALSAAPSEAPAPVFVQAADFPYYLCPRDLWESELVWLKNAGIDTIRFSIPWNWHEVEPGVYDFTGRTSPRRDLQGMIRILRRLRLHAWVNAAPEGDGWPNEGRPLHTTGNPAAQIEWWKAVGDQLAPQTAAHGGPIALAQGVPPQVTAPGPPAPVALVSALDANALARSREVIGAGRGSLVWTDVNDRLYPEGWASGKVFFRQGAIGLSGEERGALIALRRSAALLHGWGPLMAELQPATMPKPATGKLPEGMTAVELTSPAASAVRITNGGTAPFLDELRVGDPGSKRVLAIPSVHVPAGQSLWLPLSVSLGPEGLCRGCSHFAASERLVYATAELLSIEYENGILAMEFSAPVAGEAVLQLEREPVGPYLASGKPGKFDWDDKALRARLPIPIGRAGDYRVRVGIAIEEPDASAFFNDASRLIISAKNTVSTTYSSPDVASRSRLLLPDGFVSNPAPKSPNEIDFEITPPTDGVHGDTVDLALETDGLLSGRARVQLMRPLSLRLLDAFDLHFGQGAQLTPTPAVASIDPRGGSTLELALRNNWPAIRTYKLAMSAPGLDVYPQTLELTIGPQDERRVTLRVFAKENAIGLQPWRVKVSGGADLDLPMACVLVPRGQTVAWSADLDGDGSPEWVLESSRARAVFSSRDGGRWMDFTWKDGNVTFLPDQGIFSGSGDVQVIPVADGLKFQGQGWSRTVTMRDAAVTVEQAQGLPEGVPGFKRGNRTLTVTRESDARVRYAIE